MLFLRTKPTNYLLRPSFALLLTAVLVFAACDSAIQNDGGNDNDGGNINDDSSTGSLPILGSASHSMDGLNLEVLLSSSDGLSQPRDLEFHPLRAGELWVNNTDDHSMLVVAQGDSDNPNPQKYVSGGSSHFHASPSALAFNSAGDFATSHETDEKTQGPNGTPEDFMGPTLWTSNLTYYDAGHGGHIDMLHNSPNGVGIAWQTANIFWVFDGYHNAVTRYNFKSDHGPGGADHSARDVARFADNEFTYVPNVVSHLAFLNSSLLVIADTGAARIVILDADSGTRGSLISPNYDGNANDQYQMNDAAIYTLVEGDSITPAMTRPAGLEIHNDVIYVTDNASSIVYGFSTSGELLDWVDTGLASGSLMGLTFDSQDRMYLVDALGDRVLRISP